MTEYRKEIPKDNVQQSYNLSELQERSIPKVVYRDDYKKEYNDIYLTIYTKCKEVQIHSLGLTVGRKPMIVFFEPDREFLLFFTSGSDRKNTLSRINQLDEFLNIGNKELLEIITKKDKKRLEELIQKNGDRIMKISCSLYIPQGQYYGHYFINSIATEEHITVKFREVGEIVKESFENELDVNENIETGTIGNSQFWDCHYLNFETEKPKYDVEVLIRVLSGRNIKTRGMKSLLIIKIGKKIEVKRHYTVIKHIEGWDKRLSSAIKDAKKDGMKFAESGVLESEIDDKFVDEVVEYALDRAKITPYDRNILSKKLKEGIKSRTVIGFLSDVMIFFERSVGLSEYTVEVIEDSIARILIGS